MKHLPKLTLVSKEDQNLTGHSGKRAATFELIALGEFGAAESARLQKLVAEVCPKAAILAIARTPRSWDLRPVVAQAGDDGPSIIRFAGMQIRSAAPLNARIREILERLGGHKDLISANQSWGIRDSELWYRRPLVDATLAHTLAGKQLLSEEQTLGIAYHLAEEVFNWHGRGIIHGHITSSNVFVKADGSISLLDAGIGLATFQLEGARSEYDSESFAPEVTGKQTVAYSADIYGLGLVYRRLFLSLCKRYQYEKNRERLEASLAPYVDLSNAMLEAAPERRPGLAEIRKCLGEARRLVGSVTSRLVPDRVVAEKTISGFMGGEAAANAAVGPGAVNVPGNAVRSGDGSMKSAVSTGGKNLTQGRIIKTGRSGFVPAGNPIGNDASGYEANGDRRAANNSEAPNANYHSGNFESGINSQPQLDKHSRINTEKSPAGGLRSDPGAPFSDGRAFEARDSGTNSQSPGYQGTGPQPVNFGAGSFTQHDQFVGFPPQQHAYSQQPSQQQPPFHGSPQHHNQGQQNLQQQNFQQQNFQQQPGQPPHHPGAPIYSGVQYPFGQGNVAPGSPQFGNVPPQNIAPGVSVGPHVNTAIYQLMSAAQQPIPPYMGPEFHAAAQHQQPGIQSNFQTGAAQQFGTQAQPNVPYGAQTFAGPYSAPTGADDSIFSMKATAGVDVAKKPRQSSDRMFYLLMALLALGLVGLWAYRSGKFDTPVEVFTPASNEELRLAWESKLPSRMLPVALSALDQQHPNHYAEELIISSAKTGDAPPSGVNVGLIRVAFNSTWEMELTLEDRRFALAMALAGVLREKMPQDFGNIERLHPGVLLAFTANAGKNVTKILSSIPADVLTRVAPSWGPAFKELIDGQVGLSCGDEAVQKLARLGTRGIESTDDISSFLKEDPERRLRAMAMLFAENNSIARSLLEILLKHPNLSIAVDSIKWGKTWNLTTWDELVSGDQLLVLAGIVPAGAVSSNHIEAMFAHPSPSMRGYAVGKAMDTIKMGHPGAYEVFRILQNDPSLLGPQETFTLAHLLESPSKATLDSIQAWLTTNPPVAIVAPLLTATSEEKTATLLDTTFAVYLKTKGWKPGVSVLRKLTTHPDEYTRLFAYNEIFSMDDHETAREFLSAALKREQKPDAQAQLQQMLTDLK